MKHTKLLGVGILAMAFAVVGCNPAPTPSKVTDKTTKVDETDEHEHGEGPHKGTIIEFGKYHAEFVVDHDKKQATVYILDGKVKDAVPIAVETLTLSIKTPQFQTELKAVPQEGDPMGKSSRFVATHDNLGKVQEFEGTVSGKIDGKPYVGDFKEEAHDHKSEKK